MCSFSVLLPQIFFRLPFWWTVTSTYWLPLARILILQGQYKGIQALTMDTPLLSVLTRCPARVIRTGITHARRRSSNRSTMGAMVEGTPHINSVGNLTFGSQEGSTLTVVVRPPSAKVSPVCGPQMAGGDDTVPPLVLHGAGSCDSDGGSGGGGVGGTEDGCSGGDAGNEAGSMRAFPKRGPGLPPARGLLPSLPALKDSGLRPAIG